MTTSGKVLVGGLTGDPRPSIGGNGKDSAVAVGRRGGSYFKGLTCLENGGDIK